MADQPPRTVMTYFAIVRKTTGYVLDAYPEEVVRHRRELGRAVIGVFGTHAEAVAAVMDAMKERARHMNAMKGRRRGFRTISTPELMAIDFSAPAEILRLAERVRRLSYRDPERFHEKKSGIAADLRRLARRVIEP